MTHAGPPLPTAIEHSIRWSTSLVVELAPVPISGAAVMRFVPWAPPYDEDEILGLLKNYYNALERLGHFQDGGCTIVHAPSPDGHVLDLSQLQDGTHIDERVLSLMRRMPFCSQPDYCITERQRSVMYTDPTILAASRDIDGRHYYQANRALDTRNARPTDLILFDMLQTHDTTVILDVEANMVTEFLGSPRGDDFMRSNASEEEKNRYASRYRNHPAQPAPTYLRELLDRLLGGLTVVNLQGGFTYTDAERLPSKRACVQAMGELRRILIEDYKWPGDDFRKDDWHREGGKLVTDAGDVCYPHPS